MRSRRPRPGLDCIEYRSPLVSVSVTEIGRRAAPDDGRAAAASVSDRSKQRMTSGEIDERDHVLALRREI